jgi:hypothetical protein
MNMKTKYIGLLLILIGFTACNNDDDSTVVVINLPSLTSGTADFSNYVALGNSTTSGMTDGALFIAGQQNSFPNLLSQQFALAGGGNFTQPLMSDNTGGLLLGGTQIAPNRLVTTGGAPLSLEDVIGPVTPTTDLLVNNPTGPFNNMGVPLAKAIHLIAPGYGDLSGLFVSPATANPFYVRMASSPTASILGDAMAQNPSFFTLWIGANDLQGYAGTGGDGSSPITDQPTFDFAIGTLISTLTSGGAQGVVVNLPYFSNQAHYRAVAWNALDPEDNPSFAAQIPLLNASFAPLNQAFEFLGMPERKVIYSEEDENGDPYLNPVLIHDDDLPNIAATLAAVLQGGGLDPLTAGLLANQYGQSRQATADDFLVLPCGGIIGEVNIDYYTQLVLGGVPAETAGQLSVNGLTYPLQDECVLIESEQIELYVATDNFNSTLQAAANGAGLAFVDANAIMQEMSDTGYVNGDFILTDDLVTGGAFSLDGLHGTARGNVIIANEIMKAIDATYGSNFEAAGKLLDVGDYPTNYSPLLP